MSFDRKSTPRARRLAPRAHEYIRPGLYSDRPAGSTRSLGAPGATTIKPRANVLMSPGCPRPGARARGVLPVAALLLLLASAPARAGVLPPWLPHYDLTM